MPRPCDLFMTVGANGTRMEQLSCENCSLRPAAVADQCITWVTGPVAVAAGHNGAFALAACESATVSQAFNYSQGRFCVQALQGIEGCFDTLVMQVGLSSGPRSRIQAMKFLGLARLPVNWQVVSQFYYGRPTTTRMMEGAVLNCSGFVDMMALPFENLTLDENVTDFELLGEL